MSEQTSSESSGIGKAIKRYLITGLLVWLPITITLWVVTYIVSTTDHLFNLLPTQWQPESYLGFNIPGLGFILAIVVLFVTGVLGANVLGRKVIEGWDSLLGRIPVVKSIYSSVKKVSESLLSDNSRSFKTPVLVPFPQPDIWTIAFVSGSLSEALQQGLPENEEYLSVYVPTTPNPTGGYYIFVRKQDVRPLAMSVDEALKYVISLGMVAPDKILSKVLPEAIATNDIDLLKHKNRL
ncbi:MULTISPECIES: DUF502 domain-containing protein [Eikenella]|uniref:DUF502 domain-containing protein n=1 Tax=Eikenella exigua TaxID=2528037 RepID=A0AAX1F7M2_9NEIS|nr:MULTISPECIES: DUF502 domain-containing protein [Eikenella]OAM28709.1 hypothetical protein A7P94_01415 [Eikenella sp. NML01-A-086]OAM41164.1 hypothetical protein A7Q02_07555 [Eikenella sp. NML97-A-109]QED92072.1 DUF502 domain-containing protein [Eikenella exigua]